MNRFVGFIPHKFLSDCQPIRIFAYNSVGGSGDNLYQLTDGQVAYITGLDVCVTNQATTTYYGYIRVFDSGDNLLGQWQFSSNVQTMQLLHIPFTPPFKLDIGDYIYMWTNHSDFVIKATLYGYIP